MISRLWPFRTGIAVVGSGWTFLSTHGLVFLAVAANPTATQREIANTVGVTERTVQSVLSDLVEDGYLARVREGRRNRYEIDHQAPMRHPMLDRSAQVRDLLILMVDAGIAIDPPREG